DYFSDGNAELSKTNLEILSGIEKVKEIIFNIKAEKQRIFEVRKKEFLKAKTENIKVLMKLLKDHVEERIKMIESLDIGELKQKHNEITKKSTEAKHNILEAYENSLIEFDVKLKDTISNISSLFRKMNARISDLLEEATEKITIDKGPGRFRWRELLGLRYETKTIRYTYIRPGNAYSKL
ncbi:hypothetical protein, partial [Nocardia mangyaensis]|uniref:hypothetical protein n=1 Tax=Nocardia mangyaensis TaxID=2213200 RepID=UPI002675ACA1